MNTTIEPVTLTIQEELDQALVRANITEAVLQQLLEKALPHARPIENEEQFREAERARLDIRKVRLLGEKGIEAVDRRYLELRQASLARKKELLEKINEPELLIEVHTTAWKRRKEEEEAERLRQIEAMREERKALIMGTGATFVPGPPAHKYVLGTTEVTVREVMEADHTTWTNLLRSFEMVAAELADLKAQEEERQRELAERLEQQQREQQAAAAELERRQRELEEREAKMREAVNEARRNELLAIGCQEAIGTKNGNIYGDVLVGVDGGNFMLKQKDLHTFSDPQWADELLAAKAAVEERNLAAKAAQEKATREALVQERVERLKAAGWSHLKSYDGKDLVQLGNDDAPIIVETFTPDVFDACISAGQAELARREAARQEQLRQEAEAAARVRLEQEQADPKTVTVERERLLRLLFSIQEMLPYAQAEGNDKWNAGLEQLSEDVMELRRDLGDETLGPTF
jgi:hypothetical protein